MHYYCISLFIHVYVSYINFCNIFISGLSPLDLLAASIECHELKNELILRNEEIRNLKESVVVLKEENKTLKEQLAERSRFGIESASQRRKN